MRKLTIMAAAFLLLSLSLVGCRTGGAPKAGTTGTGNAQQGGAKVSLNFLQNKPEVVKEWDKLIKNFESNNPNITIKQINPPNTDTALQSDLAKGQMPDLIAMGADATFIQMAQNGVFKDLSNASELGKVSSAYTKMLESEVGKTTPYAIPYTVNAVPIIYNSDLLKKYNLKAPGTWKDLMDEAKQIKSAGGTPFYNGFKDAWTVAPVWNSLAANTEPAGFQKQLVKGTADITKADVKAAQRMIQFVSYGQSNQFGVNYNDANVAFANGKSVFYAQGIWTLPVIRQTNANIKLGTFVIPADDPNTTKMVSGVDSLLTVPDSGNQNKVQAAMKFIDFLLQPKNAGEYANIAGLFSTVTGVKNSDSALTPLQSYITKGRVVDFDDHYYPPAMAAGNQYESVLQGALSSKLSADQILKKLDALYKQSAAHK